jgi:DNA mismatch repair ATPase MutS
LYRTTPKINVIHRSVSKTVDLLKSYVEIIKLIEEENFTSEKLTELKNALINKNGNAQQQIQVLSNLVNRLDFRLNLMVAGPLNLFFFWDIWQSIKLENWKKQNINHISLWFETMAQFEAIASLSNSCFNNPDWILPEIITDHFQLKTQGLGHPLIPENRRICNDLEIDKSGKIVLVTGSNMSGKSTFLRTCGINIVLAMTGAPVCAKKMKISHVVVFTSMRIIDSLEENTSSFYAELKRLATIIKTVEQKEKVFLLLDEILRGTNSNDRHIGSVALIKQLIKNDSIGIIATHDLALSQLGNELPDQIDNYNFDVKIENDELYFDYKLNQGICKSLNASILMKKMGIKI